MKALSYIISLIFLWSTGAMAFAPGFLQVAGGGGGGGYCASNPGYVFCDDFTSGISNWDATSTDVLAHETGLNSGSIKITSDSADNSGGATLHTEMSLTTGNTYNWTFKIYIPCSDGIDTQARLYVNYIKVYEGLPTCGSWVTQSGTFEASSSQRTIYLAEAYNLSNKIVYFDEVRIW